MIRRTCIKSLSSWYPQHRQADLKRPPRHDLWLLYAFHLKPIRLNRLVPVTADLPIGMNQLSLHASLWCRRGVFYAADSSSAPPACLRESHNGLKFEKIIPSVSVLQGQNDTSKSPRLPVCSQPDPSDWKHSNIRVKHPKEEEHA